MTQSNIFKVRPEGLAGYPFELAVARGLVPGHSVMHKFGKVNPSTVDTLYDMWTGVSAANPLYTFCTTASKMKVSSSSVNDVAAGTGSCCVNISGLDANYKEINEDINITGQTPVETVNAFIRVFRVYSTDAGVLEANDGTIYVYETSEASVIAGVPQTETLIRARIEALAGQSEMAIFTVPAGKTAYLNEVVISVSNKAARYTDVNMSMKIYGNGGFRRIYSVAFEAAGTTNIHPTIPGVFNEKTDIKLQATTTATATSSIYGRFHLTLVDNE